MLRETVAKMCHWKQWDGHEETGEHVSATDSCGPASLTRSDAASPVNFSPTSKSATKSSHRELGRMLFPGGDKVGIRVLYAPEKPVIDLVFIHGLKGDSYSTWLDTRSGTYWPVHLLQYDVPNARIMTFGYNADPVKGPGSVGQNDLRDHAYTLLGDLARVRRADPQRKLAFIVHDLGGLIIKKALCMSESSAESHLNHADRCTVAVAFLGTPHRGLAKGTLIKGLADTLRLVYKEVNSNILHPLKRNSQVLAEIEDSFAIWLRKKGDRFTLTCFYEELRTIGRGLAVRKDSGRIYGFPIFSLASHHTDMARFPNSSNTRYKRVAGEISRWVDDVEHSHGESLPSQTPRSSACYSTVGLTREEIDCLQSLSFAELDQRTAEIEPPADGTCAWMLDHSSYCKWLSQERSLLWIMGKPGAGKSTLMKYILQDLQKHKLTSSGKVVTISFFFNGRGTEIQRTPLGLFRALLFQLLERFPHHLSEMVETCMNRREKRGQLGEKCNWSLQELKSFFEISVLEILKDYGIRIVVDALDECGEQSATELIRFFKRLHSKHSFSKNSLSICFSSRHFPRLPLAGGFEICVEDENQEDIKIHVRNELRGAITQNEELKDLQEDILNQSSHIFRWVRLVVDRALSQHAKGYSLPYIRGGLQDTPQEMHDVYESVFQELGKSRDNRLQSLQLVQWICFATRPLLLPELRSAMVTDWNTSPQSKVEGYDSLDFGNAYDEARMEMRIKDLSGHLAEIVTRDGRRVIQFMHQSIYDYLLEGGLKILDTLPHTTHTSISWAHFRLSRSCINYFTMPEIHKRVTELEANGSLGVDEKMGIIENEFPFLRYSIGAWYWHAQVAEQGGIPQGDLLVYWQWPSPHTTQTWLILCNWAQMDFDRPDLGSTFLHTACFYGLASTVKDIVDDVFCTDTLLNSEDRQKRTPLHYAANGGYWSVVQLLLLRKDIESDPRDVCGTTPLSHAAAQGHLEVIKVFLKDPSVNVNSMDEFGMTPLSGASEQGHENVVRLLIANKAINARYICSGIQSPLLYAATGGYESILNLLIEASSLDQIDGAEAISAAARHGHDGVVKLLLQSVDVYIDFEKHSGMIPLVWAAERGHEKVVKLLLEHADINVNARDKYGFTALSLAAAGGFLEVAELLLRCRDIDIASEADDGMTALGMATRSGHDQVVELLESRSAC